MANIDGFTKARPVRKRRQCWLGYGGVKAGKTRFGLTFPGPIAVINFDRDLEDVLVDFPSVDVEVANFGSRLPSRGLSSANDGEVKDIAAALEADIRTAMESAFASPHIRTVIVDKETTLWEIVRLAEFGRTAGVRARNYEAPNLRMRNFYQMYQESDKNLYLVSDCKDEWKDDKPTGRQIHDGFKQGPGLAQVCVRFHKNPFSLTFEECGLNAGVVGASMEGDMLDFKKLAPLCQTETSEEDWA